MYIFIQIFRFLRAVNRLYIINYYNNVYIYIVYIVYAYSCVLLIYYACRLVIYYMVTTVFFIFAVPEVCIVLEG